MRFGHAKETKKKIAHNVIKEIPQSIMTLALIIAHDQSATNQGPVVIDSSMISRSNIGFSESLHGRFSLSPTQDEKYR